MAIPFVGLIIGAIFGASLVLTGLTDPDRIIGSLRLKDFHALRTIIVSVLVATLGVWLLGLAGAAHLDIKPAAILTVLLGGAFVGIGLGLTGFSPTTGLACAASGRIDALVAVIGMFFGAHVYILIYPAIVLPLEKVLNFGQVTLPQVTGTSQIIWIAPVFAAGLVALVLTRRGGSGYSELPTEAARVAGFQPAIRGLDVLDAANPGVNRGSVYGGGPAITTDGLDAVRVFRWWKNSLFVVMVLTLVCLQAIFWLTNTGQVQISRDAVGVAASKPVLSEVEGPKALGMANADEPIATDAQPSAPVTMPTRGPELPRLLPFDLTLKHITLVIHAVNTILIFACVLYALTMYIALSVSIRNRLGGLTHISRAFYFSLLALILLLPWQIVLAPVGVGTIYTPHELAKSCTILATSTFETALFYLRFTGIWAMVCLVLIIAQWRSFRWIKTVVLKYEDAGRHTR